MPGCRCEKTRAGLNWNAIPVPSCTVIPFRRGDARVERGHDEKRTLAPAPFLIMTGLDPVIFLRKWRCPRRARA
jgi:hypothetical protein